MKKQIRTRRTPRFVWNRSCLCAEPVCVETQRLSCGTSISLDKLCSFLRPTLWVILGVWILLAFRPLNILELLLDSCWDHVRTDIVEYIISELGSLERMDKQIRANMSEMLMRNLANVERATGSLVDSLGEG